MSEYKEGIYDQLVTRRLRQFLDGQPVLKSSVEALEEAECPDYLPRHLSRWGAGIHWREMIAEVDRIQPHDGPGWPFCESKLVYSPRR